MDWKEWFYYDESSPTFLRWKVEIRSGQHKNIIEVSPGDVAGTINKNLYSFVQLKGKLYAVSRVIYELMHNVELLREEYIDHINGDIRDNSISNLRIVTHKVNTRNQCKRINNKSGVTGVHFNNHTETWVATWYDEYGKPKRKSYSINKYREDARLMAISKREFEIKRLKEIGLGYTERHGK